MLNRGNTTQHLLSWEAVMQNGKSIEIFKLQAIIYHLSAGIKDQNRGVSNLASFLCQPRAIQNFFG